MFLEGLRKQLPGGLAPKRRWKRSRRNYSQPDKKPQLAAAKRTNFAVSFIDTPACVVRVEIRPFPETFTHSYCNELHCVPFVLPSPPK